MTNGQVITQWTVQLQIYCGCYTVLNAVQGLVMFLSLKSAYRDREKAQVLNVLVTLDMLTG